MMLIRPMRQSDFGALCEIAEASGPGFSSLTTDPDLLQGKIDASEAAFAATVETPGSERYLFSLEDTATGKVGGCCGVEAAVGMDEPFYNYRVGTIVHASRELDVYRNTPTLYLSNDYTGASELCTLFLNPEFRSGGNGRLLSKCRFLFMAEHRERFNERVIAEMRGWSDEHGQSPFWEALGRNFFNMDYARADHLSAVSTKAWIAELMPRYPVYTTLLPAEAQAVIGKVHPGTEPALRMLKAEGFRYTGYVDIFDAGAAVDCLFDDVRGIRKSRLAQAELVDKAPAGTHRVLISNTALKDFRCVLVETADPGDQADRLALPADCAQALQVERGDTIRYLVIR